MRRMLESIKSQTETFFRKGLAILLRLTLGANIKEKLKFAKVYSVFGANKVVNLS